MSTLWFGRCVQCRKAVAVFDVPRCPYCGYVQGTPIPHQKEAGK